MKGLVLKNSKWSKMTAPRQLRAKGFTLIELLVTIAMSSIVLAAIGSVYMGLTRSYTHQNVAADVQQTMRAGIDFMVEDIMMAGMDSTENADAGFEAARPDFMQFTSDRLEYTDNLGSIEDTENYERIIYQYDADQDILFYRKRLADGLEPLIENVTDLSFVYLDEDGNSLADTSPPFSVLADDLDRILTVVISMTVREPAGRAEPVERTYTTRVRCRNLGLD